MKKLRFLFLVVLLLPISFSIGLDNTKKARVDEALGMIENFAHGKRIAGGYMLSAVGLGFGVGAFLASRSDYPQTRTTGAVVLGITGAVFAGVGVCSFFLPADFERLPLHYRVNRESAEVGERYLLQLRDQARTHRLIGMTTLFVAGLSQVATFVAGDRNPDSQWLVYSGAALTGLGGFGLMFFETIPEKAWNKYHAAGGQTVGISFAPLLGGGAVAQLSAEF